ncbi:hypothetical protein J6590_034533 [Homalodisca vitripennis]|nr:hypothetical protein J6590_034533 [Homalodisca vitripennis]
MENNQVLNVNKDAINPGIEDESEQREEAEQTPTIPRANQVNILTAVDNQSRMNENSATNTYAANFPDSLISQSTALHAIMNENIKSKSQIETKPCEPLQVICTGGDSVDRQVPKFNGRSTSPMEFLQKIRRYYKKNIGRVQLTHTSNTEHLIDILESSLEGHASRWFQLIKHDIKNWEDFAQEFTTKYWSRDVQRGIRAKIESEHYKNNGTLTRAEYFTERVITLQSITPLLTEEEIVTILSERFEQIIQDSRSVQNINTIKEFERLLQREDIRDGPKRNKIISSQNHNSSGYKPIHQKPHQSPVTPHNNIEQRAYQPRNQYHGQNQHYNDRNQHNKNYYHPYNSRNDNEFKSKTQPYKDHYQNRQNTHYYPGNDRHYPTTEQAQVCTIVQQGENARNLPSSTGNDRSEDVPAAGNGCAL